MLFRSSQARISGLERGEANPTLETLVRVADALGSHIDATTLLQAMTGVYVAAGVFVPMKTYTSTFVTDVTEGPVTTRPFDLTADNGLLVADIPAGDILVSRASTPGFLAPGFIPLTDVAFGRGVTFLGGSASMSGGALVAGGGLVYATAGQVTKDESSGKEQESPSGEALAANSELALAA